MAPQMGLSSCIACDAGAALASGAESCVGCVAGRFLNSSLCAACRRGRVTAAPRASACEACAPGFFAAADGLSVCTACAAGTYSTAAEATACVTCGVGRRAESALAAFACVVCASGRYSSSGATSCTSCTAAHFADASNDACWGCPAGQTRFVAAVDGEQCASCAEGRFRERLAMVSASGDCSESSAGRWTNAPGATASTPCAAGARCRGAAATQCALGRYAPHGGVTACLACGPGYIASALLGATACTACGVGRYQPGGGNGQAPSSAVACHACVAGRFSDAEGASSCVVAREGRFVASTGASAATLCPIGHFCSGTTSTTPQICGLGTYAAIVGHAACVQCRLRASDGMYTSSAGASTCSSCSSGRFATLPTQTACFACPIGTFALEGLATACTACSAGRYANMAGSTTCIACTAGMFINMSSSVFAAQSTCERCPRDTFAPMSASTACSACIAGESTRGLTGAVSCTRNALNCPPGTYLFDAKSDTSCTGCPAQGTVCEANTLTVLPNFWYAAISVGAARLDDAVEVFPCINDQSCVAPLPAAERDPRVGVDCTEGYSSVLCGACDRTSGFVRSGQGCIKCWHTAFNVLIALLIAAGLFCALLWVIAFKNFEEAQAEYHTVIAKMLMSYSQMLMVLGIFKARGTDLFNELTQRPAEIIGGSVTSTFPIKCLVQSSLYRPFLINMLSPVLIAGATLLVIGPVWVIKVMQRRTAGGLPVEHPLSQKCDVTRCRKRALTPWETMRWREQRNAARERTFAPLMRFQSVLVFAMFSIYPTLVKSLASVLRCTAPINGVQYLEDDLSVVCWEGSHWWYVLFGILCGTIYLVGTPLAIVILLARNRFQLNETKFRGTFSFLYNGYSTDRGVLVVSWEALVMLRKLVITAIAVSSSDPYTQVLVALLLLILSYGLHEHYLPYETRLLNGLESAGLFALILTQVLSILYLYVDSRARATNGHKDVLLEIVVTVALTACNAGIMLAMLVGIAYSWRRTSLIEQHRETAFNEPEAGEWGQLTPYRNPRIQEALRWEYTMLIDTHITVLPEFGSELTGQLLERGATVFVDRRIDRFRRVGCTTVRRTSFLGLSGGQGWIIDRDPRTFLTHPTVRLVGCTVGSDGKSGRFERKVWRFQVLDKVVKIQTASLPWPYVHYSGETLKKGASVLIDRFVERSAFTGHGFQRGMLTFLHLADERGWVVEPSKLPISRRGVHSSARAMKLMGTETLVRSADQQAAMPLFEYSVDALADVYVDCVWPGVLTGGVVLPHSNVLVANRAQLQVTLESKHRCRKPVQAIVTFLELVDGRGWILLANPQTAERVAAFVKMREDSVDLVSGRSAVCFRYRNVTQVALPILVEPSKHSREYTEEELLFVTTGRRGSISACAGAATTGSDTTHASAAENVAVSETGPPLDVVSGRATGAAEAGGGDDEFDGKLVTITIAGEGKLGLRLGVDPVTATVVVISVSETGLVGQLGRRKVREGDHLRSIAGRHLESFEEMDEDGDNAISRDEVRSALRRLRGVAPTEEELGELWERCDEDGDGEVSLEEFTAVLAEWVLDEAMAQMGSELRPYELVFGRPRPVTLAEVATEAAAAAAAKRTVRTLLPGADFLATERVKVKGVEYARICDMAVAQSEGASVFLHARNMGWVQTSALELVALQIGAEASAPRFECVNRIWTYVVKVNGCPVRTEPNARATPIVTLPLASTAASGEIHVATVAAPPPPLLLKGDVVVASNLLVKAPRHFLMCPGVANAQAAGAVVFAQIRQLRRSGHLVWSSARAPGWWCATVDPQTREELLELELETVDFSSAVLSDGVRPHTFPEERGEVEGRGQQMTSKSLSRVERRPDSNGIELTAVPAGHHAEPHRGERVFV